MVDPGKLVANSVVTVLPRTSAPERILIETGAALIVAVFSLYIGEPKVVLYPLQSIISFQPMGMPCNIFLSCNLSIFLAALIAFDLSICVQALTIFSLFSTRSKHDRTRDSQLNS